MNFARKCENIIFSRSWCGLFDELTDHEAGAVIKAVCADLNGSDDVQLEDPRLEGVRLTLATQIEARCRNYLMRRGEA